MGKAPKPTDGLTAARAVLKPFLDTNPLASLEEESAPRKKKRLAVMKPWGDASVVLNLPDDLTAISEALNNVFLPARYSGVWHRDTKSFEVLWTAFKLSSGVADVVGREFIFKFRGKEFKCRFDDSSKRVIEIAKASMPTGQTETSYRNLYSFEMYVAGTTGPFTVRLGKPISFWIENIDWNEDYVFALTTSLNFYLSYYDASSPVILTHSPPTTEAKKPTRYTAGKFPKNIKSTEIDPALLHLWEAARNGDPTNRFLYYYRVIEYSSIVYLDSSARTALRIALALPNALDDLTAVTETVVAAVQKMKLDEFNRYDMMLKEVVDPKLLFRELALNFDHFAKDCIFEGGFKVSSLLGEGRKAENYTEHDVSIFGSTIRNIRNALAHGRDQRTGTTITPTLDNSRKLQSWIPPVRMVAAQVILFKGVF